MKNTFVLFMILLCGDAFAAATSEPVVITIENFKGYERQIAAFVFDMTTVEDDKKLPNGMFPRAHSDRSGVDHVNFMRFLQGEVASISIDSFSKAIQNLQEDANSLPDWADRALDKKISSPEAGRIAAVGTARIISKMEDFFLKHNEILSVFYRQAAFMTNPSELDQKRLKALEKYEIWTQIVSEKALESPEKEEPFPHSPRKRGFLEKLRPRKNSLSAPALPPALQTPVPVVHFDDSADMKKTARLTPRSSSSDSIASSSMPTATPVPVVPMLPLDELLQHDDDISIALERTSPELEIGQSIRGVVEAGNMTPDLHHRLACYIKALSVIADKGDPATLQSALVLLQEFFKTV